MVEVRDRLEDFVDFLEENVDYTSLRYVLLLVIVAVVGYFYTAYVTLTVLLVMTVGVSFLVRRLEINRLGIEMATFGTVLSGIAFGPEQGALLGLVFIVLQLFSGRPPGLYLLWVVPSYMAAGYLVGGLGIPVNTLGVIVAVFIQSFFVFMTFLVMRDRVPRYLQYAFFNIVFNAILFTVLGTPVLELMQ